jgi:PAS domain S-box-containing protein
MTGVSFSLEQLNRLFPFFIKIDRKLKIVDYGKSLRKLLPGIQGESLLKVTKILRPQINELNFEQLKEVNDQLIVVSIADARSTSLRGQFDYLESEDNILFIGSPWYGTIEELNKSNLCLDDFALHDPLIDLLHLVKAQDITTNELKEVLLTLNRQKDDLKRNSERLKVLSRIAQDNINAVIISDRDGKIIWANKSFSEMTGFSPIEYLGRKPGHLLQGKDTSHETAQYLKYQLANACSFNAEILNYTKTGKEYWVRVQGQPIFDEGNNLTGFFAIEENITREKEIQNQLLESERKLGLALEKIGDNVWENNFLTGKTQFSGVSELLGSKLNTNENYYQLWRSHIHPKDRDLFDEYERKESQGEIDSHRLEYRVFSNEGRIHWILDRGLVIEKDSLGKPIKIIGTHTDITKTKEVEIELENRVSQFKSLSENIPAVIYEYVFKANGLEGIQYVSPSMKSVFGICAQDFLENSTKYLHPDDLPMIAEANQRCRRTLEPFTIEARLVIPGKGVTWHTASSSFARKTSEGDLIFTGIMLNTTDRKNAELALQVNEERYRNIISNMNLGLLEVDVNDRILFANDSFCKLTGYSFNEMQGKKAAELFLNEDNRNVIHEKSKLRKNGFSDAYEILLYTKTGDAKWVIVSGAPRYNDKGEYIGSIGIHVDITEQKNLEELLIKAKEEALNLAKTKELFLANMSHEIRTPLNAIIGMVRELNLTALNPNQKLLLDHADASSSHLLSLVNNILDLSKINSGNFELDRTSFQIGDVFREVSSITHQLAINKLIEISFDVFDGNHYYFGDPARLRQVLINVISNSIKFTEKGSVKIRCTTGKTHQKQHEIHISIADTGIGMDASFIHSIFEKFSQENNSIQRKYGGTGLGMAITKQIVEMMNGHVEVSSEKGKGTIFNITLWLEIDENPVVATEHQTDYQTILDKRNILLVEDNEMNQFVAKNLLARYGLNIVIASNGQLALNELAKSTFDLILMDLQMPVMDGLEATKRIRLSGCSTPILALTANAFKDEIDRSLEAGMNDFVSKPFDEHILLKKMCQLLEPGHTKLEDKKPAHKSNKDASVQIDETFLNSISGGNPEFTKQIYQIFLQQSESFLKESHQQATNKQWKQLKHLAHQFKPQGAYLGVNLLTKVVGEVENECHSDQDELLIHAKLLEINALISSINEQIESKLRNIA